jgi:Flp pilus assembly protein TadD
MDAPEIEEAAEFARRAAKAALAGSPRVFAEALDVDGVLLPKLGLATWNDLRPRQRDQLRQAVREQFFFMLATTRAAGSEIAWSWAQAAAQDVHVLLGLKIGDKTLKTRWVVRRVGAGWKVTDIVLSDPGISMADMAISALGPEPVRHRQPIRDAQEAAYPRLIGLGAIALILLFVAPRIRPTHRVLLYLITAAPAILFAVDGVLAVQRTLAEKYALREPGSQESWREAEKLALDAERDGRVSEASRQWARALAHGGPSGPIEYEMGLAALRRGDTERARLEFERALAERKPAPGAARELASLDAANGLYEDAERNLERYIALAGPDPESLSFSAVLQANLGRSADSLRSLEQARTLVGDAWRAAELEAQVRARAGDAPGAVPALRSLDAQGFVNRASLRADPNYLSIATDPAWVAFINEGAGGASGGGKPRRQ